MPSVLGSREFRSAATTVRAPWPSNRASPWAWCGGANHDWRDVQKKRLQREGSFPVPHYWDHVRWVWGGKDVEEFMTIAENVHLDGVLDRIKVPFLVTHGEKDSQIPLQWGAAHV